MPPNWGRPVSPKTPPVPPRRTVGYVGEEEYDPWVHEASPRTSRFAGTTAKAMPKRDPVADYHARRGGSTPADGRRSTPTGTGTAGGVSNPTGGRAIDASSSSVPSWTWANFGSAFTGVNPDQMMWIRDTYTELEQYLLDKYNNILDTRNARSYVDRSLHRMHTLCTGEEQVASGNNLQSKWRRWICRAVLAMSGVSEPSMATTVEWLTADEINFDARKVLSILHDLEKKDRATKIYRFALEQLSVLCTHPSPDSVAPPDPEGAIMFHLSGMRRLSYGHNNVTTTSRRYFRDLALKSVVIVFNSRIIVSRGVPVDLHCRQHPCHSKEMDRPGVPEEPRLHHIMVGN